MAHRYRIVHASDGDITDPRDLTRNLEEVAAEVNGRIDRDNIVEQGITTAMIKGAAFNQFRQDSFANGAADVELNKDTLAYQRTGNNGNRLGKITIDLDVAMEIRAFWSAEWTWDYSTPSLSSGDIKNNNNNLRFTLQIDGVEVSRIHRRNALNRTFCGFMVGVQQLPAGQHTIEVLGRLWDERYDDTATMVCTVLTRELLMWGRRR